MDDEFDARDQYGNRYKARRAGGGGNAVDQHGNRYTVRRDGDGCLGSPLLLIAVIVFVLIIGAISGVLWLVHSTQNYVTYHGFTSNSDEAQAGASVTAVASEQSPYGGKLVLADPLQNNSKGYKWEESNDNQGDVCGFKNGAYHVSVSLPGAKGYPNNCAAEASNLSNFAYQITMSLGNASAGSIFFRMHRDPVKFTGYEFNIDSAGYFDLAVYTGDSYKVLANSATLGGSAIRFDPTQPIVLAVVAKGNRFDLYINYQHLTTVNDSTFSRGQIGVEVYPNKGTPQTEAIFSDLKVWQI